MVYSEGIHVGYRAWLKQQAEGGAAPALALGYTTFELSALYAAQFVPAGNDVLVHVPVHNTGSRSGREVV